MPLSACGAVQSGCDLMTCCAYHRPVWSMRQSTRGFQVYFMLCALAAGILSSRLPEIVAGARRQGPGESSGLHAGWRPNAGASSYMGRSPRRGGIIRSVSGCLGGGLAAFRTLKHPRLDIGSCVQHMVCTREVASWVGQSSVRLDSGLVSGWERRVQPCGQQS